MTTLPAAPSPVPTGPPSEGSQRRRLLLPIVVAGSVVVLTLAALIGAVVVLGSVDLLDSDQHAEPVEVARFAGFGSTTGLEITDARLDSWLDTVAEFALRGAPTDIDRALAAADFTVPFAPGVHVQEPSTVAATAMTDARSAQDTWIDGSGRQVHRRVVRDALASEPGREVLHVLAFTT